MRDAYVPFFRDLLTSGVWFEDPAIRCVWIALVLNADAEGFVRLNLRGLQREANVPLDVVREALALFEAPDPDSRDQELEGRRLVAVERGWRLVTFEAHRRRARLAAERARKARWDRANRSSASEPDADEPSDVGTRRLSDAQKQKPKRKQIPEGEIPPAPPMNDDGLRPLKAADEHERTHADLVRREMERRQAEGTTLPAAYHTLDGWEPTEADIAYAEMAGLPRADFLEAIAKARLIPRIGGAHGVRDQGAWVRLQVPRWKRWKEEASAKQSFGRAPAPVEPIRPRRKERDHAVHWGYDIDALFEAINAEGWPAKAGAEGARREAQRRMAAAAKAAKGAA
jgi:hypothetical protein